LNILESLLYVFMLKLTFYFISINLVFSKNTIFSKPRYNIIHQEYRIQPNIYHAHFHRPIFNRTRLLRIVYGSTYRCRLRHGRNIQSNPVRMVSFYSLWNISDVFRVLRTWRRAMRRESPNFTKCIFQYVPQYQ